MSVISKRNDYSQREGPCIVEYRDHTWNGHPTYRQYSCWGCRFLEMDDYYGTQYCHHPLFKLFYDSKQSVGGNGFTHRWKCIVHVHFCPILRLRGETDHLPQPEKQEIDRGPEYEPRGVWDLILGKVWPWAGFGRPLRMTRRALLKSNPASSI